MDELFGSFGKALPELRDRLAGDVEADEIKTAFDEWDVVPSIAATDVETSPRFGRERANGMQDVINESDGWFLLVAPPLVLAVPRRFGVVSHRPTLGRGSSPHRATVLGPLSTRGRRVGASRPAESP